MITEAYTHPRLRSILAGILAAAAFFIMFAFLADVVKWTGAALLFLPAQFGIIRQPSPNEIIPVDFSHSPSEVTFPAAGQYAFYTSNYDLLTITDTLIESGGKPWLAITSASGSRLPVTFIARGLRPYDTPLASGRPIYTFKVPAAGTYSITHPTRPMLTVYFVRDYVSGHESLYTTVLLTEVLALGGVVFSLVYRRFRQKERHFETLRRQKRQEVETFWQERQRKKEGEKERSRWDDL